MWEEATSRWGMKVHAGAYPSWRRPQSLPRYRCAQIYCVLTPTKSCAQTTAGRVVIVATHSTLPAMALLRLGLLLAAAAACVLPPCSALAAGAGADKQAAPRAAALVGRVRGGGGSAGQGSPAHVLLTPLSLRVHGCQHTWTSLTSTPPHAAAAAGRKLRQFDVIDTAVPTDCTFCGEVAVGVVGVNSRAASGRVADATARNQCSLVSRAPVGWRGGRTYVFLCC